MQVQAFTGLEDLKGVEARYGLHDRLVEAVNLAAALHAQMGVAQGREELIGLGAASGAALLAVNSLLTASTAKCNIGAPPLADIDMRPDTSGQLIFRCQHPTPHRWTLDGVPLP